MKAHWSPLILALLLACVSGLALAGQPKVMDLATDHPEQAVTLKIQPSGSAWAWNGPKALNVYAVDEVPVKTGFQRFMTGNAGRIEEIRFLPGKHRVQFTAQQGTLQGSAHLWFVAQPGHSYLARMEFRGITYRIWIQDLLSGRDVGGIVGSVDEPGDEPAAATAAPAEAPDAPEAAEAAAPAQR